MATLDFTQGQSVISDGKPHPPLQEQVLDFSITNGTGADVCPALDVLAGYWVVCVALEILTAEGGTLTVDVGDGTDPDGYMDGVNMNATVGDIYTSVIPHSFDTGAGDLALPTAGEETDYGILSGKVYAADDTIDVLINDAAATAVMRITADVVQLRGQKTFGTAPVVT